MAFPKNAAPEDFEDSDFMSQFPDIVSEFADLRAKGYHPHTAFHRVFGKYNGGGMHEVLVALEANRYVQGQIAARLKTITIDELWNTKTSLHELLSVSRDIFAKDTTRLNAIKELNVMVGITVVDESGKTKAGRSLADFYKEQEGLPLPGEVAPTHKVPTH